MPRLGGPEPSPFRAPAATPRPKRSRGVVATVGAFAVAAAAVAVVLGIGLVQANHKVSNLQQAAGHQVGATVAAALQTPGHQVIDLDSTTTHRQLAEFVVVPDGRGFLVSSRPAQAALGAAPTSSGGSWATRRSRWGCSARRPRQATFTMAGSVQPMQLSITAEPAGGSVIPTGSVVATGTV